jgi:hypothetical protein
LVKGKDAGRGRMRRAFVETNPGKILNSDKVYLILLQMVRPFLKRKRLTHFPPSSNECSSP